ncbi:hypothetical protein HOLleu_10386 [Holothuria leucospilota]|uniref:MADF domain-containing protein n=1 Tax=Holothuria leucospilota TaxID=206669 RepID=A0A9Q1CER9_HOLLE|nr:hypothetical protein HOLleu_10386 [Holothuria leucospilota]
MASKRLSKDETEQLIELVRQKPYLYDVTDPDHADATKVANAWQAITEKMGLQDKGYSLKEKWKNLRDYYIRKRREQKGKSGDGAKQKVKWPFFELMQFLNDYAVENSQTDSNVDEVPITKEDEQDLSTYDADTQREVERTIGETFPKWASGKDAPIATPPIRSRIYRNELEIGVDQSHESTIESQEASDDDRSTNQLSQTSRQNERASMPAVKNLPRQERKVKRRSNTDDPLDEEIKQLIRERKQDRKELIGMSNGCK